MLSGAKNKNQKRTIKMKTKQQITKKLTSFFLVLALLITFQPASFVWALDRESTESKANTKNYIVVMANSGMSNAVHLHFENRTGNLQTTVYSSLTPHDPAPYLTGVTKLTQPIIVTSYTISYNKNTGSGSMANTPATYGTSVNLRSNAFTKTGSA